MLSPAGCRRGSIECTASTQSKDDIGGTSVCWSSIEREIRPIFFCGRFLASLAFIGAIGICHRRQLRLPDLRFQQGSTLAQAAACPILGFSMVDISSSRYWNVKMGQFALFDKMETTLCTCPHRRFK